MTDRSNLPNEEECDLQNDNDFNTMEFDMYGSEGEPRIVDVKSAPEEDNVIPGTIAERSHLEEINVHPEPPGRAESSTLGESRPPIRAEQRLHARIPVLAEIGTQANPQTVDAQIQVQQKATSWFNWRYSLFTLALVVATVAVFISMSEQFECRPTEEIANLRKKVAEQNKLLDKIKNPTCDKEELELKETRDKIAKLRKKVAEQNKLLDERKNPTCDKGTSTAEECKEIEKEHEEIIFALQNVARGHTCNIPNLERVSCGGPGISKEQCEERRCCYDFNITNTVHCFNPRRYQQKTCDIQAELRSDCGYSGITEDECLEKGCCYDDSTRDTMWCYYKQWEIKVFSRLCGRLIYLLTFG